jgi:hypothetical protein
MNSKSKYDAGLDNKVLPRPFSTWEGDATFQCNLRVTYEVDATIKLEIFNL